MSNHLTLAKALMSWFTSQLEGVHTAIPATIDSYDPNTRMAKVLAGVQFRTQSGASVAYKPVVDVPVMFAGGSDWEIVAPLKKGDTGLLICSEASIGNWLAGDGIEQVIPEDATRFSMQDAIFIPGLYPKSRVPKAHEGLWVRYKDTSLNITDGEVKVIGKLTVSGAIEAGEEVTAMTTLVPVKLSTHIHGTGVGPSTPPQAGT